MVVRYGLDGPGGGAVPAAEGVENEETGADGGLCTIVGGYRGTRRLDGESLSDVAYSEGGWLEVVKDEADDVWRWCPRGTAAGLMV